jgi:preprotein translocase subunit SecD
MSLFLTLGFITIIVLLLGEHLWSPLISNVHAAVRFEVRLAEDTPAPGLHEAKVSGTDRSVYLHDEVIVTNSDISGARIVRADSSSQYNVAVEFTASGAEKMRAATARHIGKPMAVLLDGQVIMAAIVREPIADSAVITGHLSKNEAERIAGGITSAH